MCYITADGVTGTFSPKRLLQRNGTTIMKGYDHKTRELAEFELNTIQEITLGTKHFGTNREKILKLLESL